MSGNEKTLSESGNFILEHLMMESKRSENKSKQHDELRSSKEYQVETSILEKTITDLIHTLRVSALAASRQPNFTENTLLLAYFEDLVEAALTVRLAIENGALNSARRELRNMLEVVVNCAYVDEKKGSETFDEKVTFFKSKQVKKRNVDNVFDLPLRLLPNHKNDFGNSVRNAWVKGSNYVHPTKQRMNEKLLLREKGIIIGMETLEMMKSIVADVHETCSIVVVLVFETIGPPFTGDLLVECLDEIDDRAFWKSEFVATVDAHFDYKHERQHRLAHHIERRNRRIQYKIL